MSSLVTSNTKGAASMAAKAVQALERNRSEVPDIFDLDLLLNKLKNVDPVPPKLMHTNRQERKSS